MALDYDTPRPKGNGNSAAKLVIAWLLVTVPAIWGVAQTVNKSLPLFQSPAAEQSPAAAATKAAPGR